MRTHISSCHRILSNEIPFPSELLRQGGASTRQFKASAGPADHSFEMLGNILVRATSVETRPTAQHEVLTGAERGLKRRYPEISIVLGLRCTGRNRV